MTRKALGDLILARQDSLYRLSKTLLSSDEDCADAIQQTIVQAFANLESLREERYAATWLSRILINQCYAVLRQRSKLVSIDSIEQTAAAPHPDYTDLYRAVEALPDELRLCVVLYYAEDYSVKEIANMLKTTESAVKNRLYRARNRLRDQLCCEEVM